ncbi:MAG: peptidylprolyl isomerase [Lachnospiraceae bacterium]|nr:peptidylprolyl isomerase [Lachnospiraceae bacterium]
MLFFILLFMMVTLTACNSGGEEAAGEPAAATTQTAKKIVLTTGFSSDEVFRINRTPCRLPEFMVYLTNTQNQYESVFGKEIWEKDLQGTNLENSIKENVLARIAQIKAMNLLAEEHAITLDGEDLDKVNKAAEEYYKSLNEVERQKMNVDHDTILEMYKEYALANKVYNDIIKDINPEISDDEARTITVQQILFKTYKLNGKGEKEQVSDSEKKRIYEKAQQVCQKAKKGEDFSALIEAYSDDKVGTYSFGKGEMEKDFETVTFNLGTDEVSDVIQSDNGYYIVKCLSTFDRDETDANKVKIVEQRKKEVFNEEYDNFLTTLTRHLNDKLWENIAFIHDEKVTTKNFFDTYTKYFEED